MKVCNDRNYILHMNPSSLFVLFYGLAEYLWNTQQTNYALGRTCNVIGRIM